MKTLPLAAVLRIRYRTVRVAEELSGSSYNMGEGAGVREVGAGTKGAAMEEHQNDIMEAKWTGFEG